VSTRLVVRRWIRFNGVGLLGVAVQLVVLAWMVRHGANYLWATAAAVEAAVLHNFVWHERWTWADRRAGSAATLLVRLARFHLVNGVISMIGNLIAMRVLTGSFGVDPVPANLAAILICSTANFAAGELLVFRRAVAATALLVALLPLTAVAAEPPEATVMAVELRPETVKAWTAYEARVDRRHAAANAASSPFFAMDAFGVRDWRGSAVSGGIAMSRIEGAAPREGTADVPDGRIHHWAGAVFVPGTTVTAVLERLSQLAGQESKHYKDVIASRLMSREGSRDRVFLKLRRSKVITVTYNSEHLVEYRRITPARATARSVSTKVAELEDAGTPGEREKPVGHDSGYLWRLNAYWRYEALNGGVLIECESVSLSRDVPFLLRPFISGVVEGLARESLERTLRGLRASLTPHS
jgi:putative flippase GtrA